MPKKLTAEDYQVAQEIYKNAFDVIDPQEDMDLRAPEISAEKAVIKVQAWNKLSNEAKEVVDVILNGPKEVANLLATPKRHTITKRSVYRHLLKVFHSKFIARQIIKEIQEWVRRF